MKRLTPCLVACALAGCTAPSAARPTASDATTPASSAPAGAPRPISEFQGVYRFLSNFWPAEIEIDGIRYPTVEHAYQAHKTSDRAERLRIAALPSPGAAKEAGHKLEPPPDWARQKFEVMERCVRLKFTTHTDLRARLLATGDAELIEGNTWGDRIWGVCDGEGENRLGKILMKLREDLR